MANSSRLCRKTDIVRPLTPGTVPLPYPGLLRILIPILTGFLRWFRRLFRMGTKLLWTGLTISYALQGYVPAAVIVGTVFMVIGLILLWLDK